MPDDMDSSEIQAQLQKAFGFVQELPPEEQKSFWDETWGDLKDNWEQYTGATAGGISGAIVGGPPGAVAGAALGGAAGRGSKIAREKITGERPGVSLKEAVKESAFAGAEEGATELIGGVIAKPVKRVVDPILKKASKTLMPFSRAITKEGREALELLNRYMPKKTFFGIKTSSKKYAGATLAEITEHRGMDIAENIASKSFFGSGTMFQLKGKIRPKIFEDMADDLADEIGAKMSPDDIGELFVDAVNDRWKNFKDTVTAPLYNTVEEITKPTVVDVPIARTIPSDVLDEFGKPMMKEVTETVQREQGGVLVTTKALKEFALEKANVAKGQKGIAATEMGDDIVRAIEDLPDKMQFRDVWELRKRLRTKAEQFEIENKKAPAIGIAKRLMNLSDEAITKALKEQNPEALEIWKHANDLYKKGAKTYQSRFIRRLLKTADPALGGEPEVILKRIFKNGGVSGIKKVKDAVGAKNWDMFKHWYLADVLERSTSKGASFPSGDSLFVNLFNESRGMGEKSLREIFREGEISRIKSVVNAYKIGQKKQAEGQGGMLIQLMQGSALIGLFTGYLSPGYLGIIVGPEILAQMMISPTMSKVITQGLTFPRMAPAAVVRILDTGDRMKSDIMERIYERIDEEKLDTVKKEVQKQMEGLNKE